MEAKRRPTAIQRVFVLGLLNVCMQSKLVVDTSRTYCRWLSVKKMNATSGRRLRLRLWICALHTTKNEHPISIGSTISCYQKKCASFFLEYETTRDQRTKRTCKKANIDACKIPKPKISTVRFIARENAAEYCVPFCRKKKVFLLEQNAIYMKLRNRS